MFVRVMSSKSFSSEVPGASLPPRFSESGAGARREQTMYQNYCVDAEVSHRPKAHIAMSNDDRKQIRRVVAQEKAWN